MIFENNNNQVYLACGPTDLRKSIDGLAVLVREGFNLVRISAGSGQPFRKHPDAVSELSGQHNGHIRTPCRVGKTFGTL